MIPAPFNKTSMYLLLLVLFTSFSVLFHLMQVLVINGNYTSNWFDSSEQSWSKKILEELEFFSPVPSCCLDIHLIIVVCSAPQNFAARQAIRTTWGRDSTFTKNAKVYFIIGHSSNNVTNMFVSSEKLEYSDIIHYNLIDTYENLTLKSISILKWATANCSNAKYIMKTDDDMFVNIPILLNSLQQSNNPQLLEGNLIVDARPIRLKSSKWYVSYESYSLKYYPHYLSGTGYIMSQNTARALYNSTQLAPFINLEDVFITGICAEIANVKPTNNKLFTYAKQRKNPCKFLSIATAHRMTPNDLYEMWDLIHLRHFRCVTSFWDRITLQV